MVIVANQELPTVRNAARIAEALRQRYGKDRVRMIVSRYDHHSEIGQGDVERVTGSRVTATCRATTGSRLHALNKGRPLAMENHSKLSHAYRDLADDLAGIERQSRSRSQASAFRKAAGPLTRVVCGQRESSWNLDPRVSITPTVRTRWRGRRSTRSTRTSRRGSTRTC